ncbi:MAG: 5'-methylthioadenosine/S-adenosylhomocysteine nucleosidase [Candidatus Absconditabacterales bacterium]|nr:5'-methylthioadenosine/S-adenosylhomocysteine nucleosidase [Candidatus Absconditabacterales bacterium]
MQKKYAIITAMKEEADHIIGYYSLSKINNYKHMTIYENDDIVLLCAGIGKIQATIATMYLCTTYLFTHCINIGIAGSLLGNKATIGDVFLIQTIIQHDMDLPFEGSHLDYAKKPLHLIVPSLDAQKYGFGFHQHGICLTGDQFISDEKKLAGLRTQFGGDVVEMEAFAIASVLDLFGKLDTMICIKAISDGADADAKDAHMDNLDFAMKNSIDVLRDIIG